MSITLVKNFHSPQWHTGPKGGLPIGKDLDKFPTFFGVLAMKISNDSVGAMN